MASLTRGARNCVCGIFVAYLMKTRTKTKKMQSKRTGEQNKIKKTQNKTLNKKRKKRKFKLEKKQNLKNQNDIIF